MLATSPQDPARLRARLANARVMLVFTPELTGSRDPLEVLDTVLEQVDAVQVRAKPSGDARGPSSARDAYEWSRHVLARVARRDPTLPVLVNDRVDVAVALWNEGLAGVHVGQEDCPPTVARDMLGPGPLIGLSTHRMVEVGAASDEPVDYLGFGPIHATPTKGYTEGLGAERAWVAKSATELPVFAIGGIERSNVDALAEVGRAAVGAGILAADDPARAARELRELLVDG